MDNYLVTWQIDVEAENHVEAAKQAWHLRNGRDSIANVFDVQKKNNTRLGTKNAVDLHQMEIVELNEAFTYDDAREIAQIASFITRDCLDNFRKVCGEGLVGAADYISKAAFDFFHEHRHITDWPTFLENGYLRDEFNTEAYDFYCGIWADRWLEKTFKSEK